MDKIIIVLLFTIIGLVNKGENKFVFFKVLQLKIWTKSAAKCEKVYIS